MPGMMLTAGSVVLCGHAGQAKPVVVNPRVTLGGQPLVTQPAPWLVAGCPNPAPAGGPCTTAQWLTAATRVLASGQPVLMQDSQGLCAPTPVPTVVVVAQTRVRGI